MDAIPASVCPGCGQVLNLDSAVSRAACRQCGEELVVMPDHRIFLAHPDSTYAASPEVVANAPTGSPETLPPLPGMTPQEKERKRISLEIGISRVNRRVSESRRLLAIGVLIIALGIAIPFLLALRALATGSLWMEAALALGVLLGAIPSGIVTIVSALIVGRQLVKHQQELQQDLGTLREDTSCTKPGTHET